MSVDKKRVNRRVRRILGEYTNLNEKEIQENSKLVEDLGLSSFDLIYVISELEEEFKISLQMTEDFAEIENVDALCSIICGLCEE